MIHGGELFYSIFFCKGAKVKLNTTVFCAIIFLSSGLCGSDGMTELEKKQHWLVNRYTRCLGLQGVGWAWRMPYDGTDEGMKRFPVTLLACTVAAQKVRDLGGEIDWDIKRFLDEHPSDNWPVTGS